MKIYNLSPDAKLSEMQVELLKGALNHEFEHIAHIADAEDGRSLGLSVSVTFDDLGNPSGAYSIMDLNQPMADLVDNYSTAGWAELHEQCAAEKDDLACELLVRGRKLFWSEGVFTAEEVGNCVMLLEGKFDMSVSMADVIHAHIDNNIRCLLTLVFKNGGDQAEYLVCHNHGGKYIAYRFTRLGTKRASAIESKTGDAATMIQDFGPEFWIRPVNYSLTAKGELITALDAQGSED